MTPGDSSSPIGKPLMNFWLNEAPDRWAMASSMSLYMSYLPGHLALACFKECTTPKKKEATYAFISSIVSLAFSSATL